MPASLAAGGPLDELAERARKDVGEGIGRAEDDKVLEGEAERRKKGSI